MSQPLWSNLPFGAEKTLKRIAERQLAPVFSKNFKSTGQAGDFDDVDEIDDKTQDEYSHLLGLKEFTSPDPNIAPCVNLLNTTTDTEIIALMTMINHRCMAVEKRISHLESKLSSVVCVEQKVDYAYAWIKGAERSKVYNMLPL